MIRPILEYADVIFDVCGTVLTQKLECIQYNAARTCLGALHTTNKNSLLEETGWRRSLSDGKHEKLFFSIKCATALFQTTYSD